MSDEAANLAHEAFQRGDVQLDYDRAGQWWDVDYDAPSTVCIRHGRHVPCRRREGDCLLSSHPNMIRLVDVYQRDTDSVRWDFEHVVKSWLYLMKGEGNW